MYPFLSTPSARRATYDILGLQRTKEFLSTPSARRATRTTAFRTTTTPNFYPRPPRGGRLCPAWLRFCGCCYFYPRPPRGGRHQCAMSYITTFNISIHALREEGDWMISLSRAIPSISIHALREEGDEGYAQVLLPQNLFLSTPSARRATCLACKAPVDLELFLSTPSARRATSTRSCAISLCIFLSTPSARRATLLKRERDALEDISIHALREEGDVGRPAPALPCAGNFYPRPPRGGRRPRRPPSLWPHYFYPRPPRGGRPHLCR